MAQFTENLKKLPKISHIAEIKLYNAAGEVVATIENKSGSQGSLAVYNHLAQTYGAITSQAATKGLEIFAEHTDDARASPGKHPHIDRLFAVVERGEILRTKHVFAL